jgi:hypothetical protein
MPTPSPLPLDAPPARRSRAAASSAKVPALLAIHGYRQQVRRGVAEGHTAQGMGAAATIPEGQGRVNRQAGPRLSVDPLPARKFLTHDFSIPIRTVCMLNAREHPMARSARVKRERIATAWALRADRITPTLPCVVTLTRCGPTRGLDPGDNLSSALKAVRDAIALWLGVNDAKEDLVRYRYAQRRERQWSVEVSIREVAK